MDFTNTPGDPRYIDWDALEEAKDRLEMIPPWLEKFIEDHVSKRGSNGYPGCRVSQSEVIGEGSRDTTLFRMGAAMRNVGLDDQEIFAGLLKVNERCDPPLAESQVRKVARSAGRYNVDPYIGVTITGGNGKAIEPAKDMVFPDPIPASLLKRSPGGNWIWEGVINRGGVTLLTALWKAGKTTLLAHLLKKLETGGPFCGLEASPARVLYITEENEDLWVDRREEMDLRDHVEFQIRPFKNKPEWSQWAAFLGHVNRVCRQRAFDVVIMDTLSNLWPVKDENDAPQVQAALMPLHDAVGGAACLLIHHNRKGDGKEATASRGSGALTAFVDTIIEFRRYDASNMKCCKRVLNGYGRYRETPTELVIELAVDGYVALGDRQDTGRLEMVPILSEILPSKPPGSTVKEIEVEWPNKHLPRNGVLTDALHHGVEVGLWQRTGEGIKGDPYRFFKP